MATCVWRGEAAAVAQVVNLTPAAVQVGDLFTVTINGKAVSYTSVLGTVADVVANLASLLGASTIPEFLEVTWAADAAGTAVVGTAATAGIPFAVSLSHTASGTIAAPTNPGAVPAVAGGSLTTSTVYYYRVTALTALGETSPGTEVNATATSTGAVTVSWTASSGATGYRIYRGTVSGSETLVAQVPSGTSFTDYGENAVASTGLTPPAANTAAIAVPSLTSATADTMAGSIAAGTYYYVITAITALGETTRSNEHSATLGGTGEIVLVWPAVTGATGYKVYRGTGAGSENKLVTTTGAVTTYTDQASSPAAGAPPSTNGAYIPVPASPAAAAAGSGNGSLTNATLYYYQVTATNAAGETTGSAEFQAYATSTGALALAWTASSNATGYNVYRYTASGSEVFIASLGAVTAWTDYGAVPAGTATVPVSNTTGSACTFALTTPTASAGPNDVGVAANWSTGTTPANGDDVVLTQTSSALLYGLSALSAITPASVEQDSTFTGTVGLPKYNPLGYFEYRPQYLQFAGWTNLLTVGAGSGSGSGRAKYDAGSSAIGGVLVLSTGAPADQGLPALILKGTNAGNVLTILQGTAGSAVDPGDTSTWATVNVGGQQNPSTDVSLTFGPGCTLGTLDQTGGQVLIQSGVTTHTQRGGSSIYQGTAAVGTLDVEGGICYYQTTGTLTAGTVGAAGTLDCSQDPRTRTFTNLTVYGTFNDPNHTVTHSNPVSLPNGLGGNTGATVNWGSNYHLARSEPMPLPHGVFSWPGVAAVEAAQVTLSHGVSPATCVLRCQPQPVFPALYGDLTITDGLQTVLLPGCRLDAVKVEQDGDHGFYWSLEIVDRRWRWRDLGYIHGWYNQLDPHGKLIPWTIRSPAELATLCLQAMGETGYTLNLPPGLTRKQGIAQISDNINQGYLQVGKLLPPTATNPAINWEGVPPALALQQLAELFGCRVIYQVSTDSVLVTPMGDGALLPPGSVHRQGPALKSQEMPDGVGVLGAPVRYQMRLALEAVGLEWDGSYRTIDNLSYAPAPQIAAAQTTTVTVQGAGSSREPVEFRLTVNGVTVDYLSKPGEDDDGSVMQELRQDFNIASINNPALSGLTAVTVPGNALLHDSGQITISGPKGKSFSVTAECAVPTGHAAGVSFTSELTQAARQGVTSWGHSFPPLFANVQAVKGRLTYQEAQQLARQSVFRMYRVRNRDVASVGKAQKPITVPGYGQIDRREQLILEDVQVDQIVPLPVSNNLVKSQDGGLGLVNEANLVYSGYSRDKPAVVYGSIYQLDNYNNYLTFVTDVVGEGDGNLNYFSPVNTPAGSQVFVPFTIDPLWQIVTFAQPVFVLSGPNANDTSKTINDAANVFAQPTLVLQCAVRVRNAETNQEEVYTQIRPLQAAVVVNDAFGTFAGTTTTNPKMGHYIDVVLNVTSTYDKNNKVTKTTVLEQDPFTRAKYYLDGLAAQYQVTGAQTLEYNGIVAIALDGAIAQVTWSVGPGGCSTTASRNTEHNIWVPPYPARRRAENLAAARADANSRRNDMIDLPGR